MSRPPPSAPRPPLDGVRVLDLTRVLAGPFGTQLLADLGADVVKVERPDGGDDTRAFGPPFVGGESTYFMSVNRGKRSVVLDLKSAAGRETVRALALRADVLVENFRPGVLDRLGLGWEALAELNPRLVFASISGFGQSGLPEHVGAPGYDLMIQCLSGVASLTGPSDGPPSKAGVSVADLVGGMYAVQGILAALYRREQTGRGGRVDIAMFEGLASLLTYNAQAHLATGVVPTRNGNRHPSICPFETFPAADGHLAICCGNDRQYARLASLLGLPDDPRFATNVSRVEHRGDLVPLIEAALGTDTVASWCARLAAADVPGGPILSVDAVLRHPQLEARGFLGTVRHPAAGEMSALGCPVRLDDQPAFNPRPAPTLGEHTAEILAELAAFGTPEEGGGAGTG